MEKQNFEGKKMYLRELSGSKFHSVISSNVILYNDVKNSIFTKSGFKLFNCCRSNLCTHTISHESWTLSGIIYRSNKLFSKHCNLTYMYLFCDSPLCTGQKGTEVGCIVGRYILVIPFHKPALSGKRN